MAKSIGDPDKLTGPGKASVMADPSNIPKTGVTDDKFDVRDILANFVGRGDRDLSNDQAKKDYHRLTAIIGEPMAQKMMAHVMIFNQRDDQKNQPFEKRLNSLYTIGSNDKDVHQLLQRTGTLGQGVVPGAIESGNLGNMMAEGTINPDLSKNTAMSTRTALR